MFLQKVHTNILKCPELSVDHSDDNKLDNCGMLAGHVKEVQDMET